MRDMRLASFALMLATSLCVGGVGVARAQQTSPVTSAAAVMFDTDRALDVDEVVRIGLERNGELRAMREEAEAAKGKARQARLLPNPMLEFKQTRSRDGMDSNVMIGGSMPLEITGRRGARIDVAVKELELKEVAVRTLERDLAVEIRRAYSAVASARAKAILIERALEFADNAFKITQAAVSAGKVAPLNEAMEAVELNKLRAMRERSAGELASAVFSLKNLIGMNPEEMLSVTTELDVDPAVILSQDAAVALGLQQRLELRGARLVESLASSRVRLARAEGTPEVELSAGIERGKSSYPFYALSATGVLGPIEKEMRMFSFGLKVSLPVLNANRGEVAAMKAEEAAARERRIFGEVSVRADIAAARTSFERSWRAVEILRSGVVEVSRKNVLVLRRTYEVGGLSLSEYLSGQRAAVETELEYVDARKNAFDARTDYLRSIGSESLVGR